MTAREDKLRAIAQLHDEFVDKQLAAAPFDPQGRPAKSDYNLHYADLEADTDDFHRRARQILDI